MLKNGNASLINPTLVHEGKIERFPHIRPGTGKKGRPGKLRLNDLPKADGLIFDEITGIAYQAPNLSREEVEAHVFAMPDVIEDEATGPSIGDDVDTTRRMLAVV